MVSSDRRRRALLEAYRAQACEGLLGCYDQTEGAVSGEVTMKVGGAGRVSKVQASFSGTPAAVAACIEKAAGARVLSGFQGPAGTLLCRYRGTVMPGSRMLRFTNSYTPAPGAGVHAEEPKPAR